MNFHEIQKIIKIIDEDEDVDYEKFYLRIPEYQRLLQDKKNTIESICKSLKIDQQTFSEESHIMACLYPGSVIVKFISPYLKSSLIKQKQLTAILHMFKHNPSLTTDNVCEKLLVNDALAEDLIKKLNIKPTPDETITCADIMYDIRLHPKIIQWFQQNPYCDLKTSIKAIGYKISAKEFEYALIALVDQGYKIPCIINHDPMIVEEMQLDVINYKQKNPYASPRSIAKKFGLQPTQVSHIIESTAEEWKREKLKSYEFYFKGVLDELELITQYCYERFHASDRSSSRWLEIAQNNTEKKIKLLGLNAPAQVNIQQHVQIETKAERDGIIDAFLATDMIDVTPKTEKVANV